MMKKAYKNRLIAFAVITALLFIGTIAVTARISYESAAEKKQKAEKEYLDSKGTVDDIDSYSMAKFSEKNSKAVFDALKSGDSGRLSKLMINDSGADKVMEFADWNNAEFDEAVSMGSGSLTAEPDDQGIMDVSERFFVDAGDERYVFFIETLTSRWGRTNEGVSAVAVTSFSHFDAVDFGWNGEKDDYSVLAGELFWNK